MAEIRPLSAQKILLANQVLIGDTYILTTGKFTRSSDGSGDIGPQIVALTPFDDYRNERAYIDQSTEPERVQEKPAGKNGEDLSTYRYDFVLDDDGNPIRGIDTDNDDTPPTSYQESMQRKHFATEAVILGSSVEYWRQIEKKLEAATVKDEATADADIAAYQPLEAGETGVIPFAGGQVIGIALAAALEGATVEFAKITGGTIIDFPSPPGQAGLRAYADYTDATDAVIKNGADSLTSNAVPVGVFKEDDVLYMDMILGQVPNLTAEQVIDPNGTVHGAISGNKLKSAAEAFAVKTFQDSEFGIINSTGYADAPTTVLTAELAGAAGSVDNGSHEYAFTFVTATGETGLSPIGDPVVVTNNGVDGQVDLTSVVISADAGVTSRKIYRRFNGAGDFKLVDTIADNVTTTYTDNIANSALGAVAPTEDTTAAAVSFDASAVISDQIITIPSGDFTLAKASDTLADVVVCGCDVSTGHAISLFSPITYRENTSSGGITTINPTAQVQIASFSCPPGITGFSTVKTYLKYNSTAVTVRAVVKINGTTVSTSSSINVSSSAYTQYSFIVSGSCSYGDTIDVYIENMSASLTAGWSSPSYYVTLTGGGTAVFSKSDNYYPQRFVGFAQNAALAGENVVLKCAGIDNNGGGTANATITLSSTPGSAVVGGGGTSVGIALGASQRLIVQPPV